MRQTLVVVGRLALRFVVIWLIETAALLWFATRFPGVSFESPASPAIIVSAVLVALALSVIGTLIQPLLIVAQLPLNIISVGASAVVVNFGMLQLASHLLPGFDIEPSFPNTVGAAVLMALINVVLTSLIALDDEYAFFKFATQVLVRHRSIRRALRNSTHARGMVVLQIDGLSPQRLHEAIERGLMPTMKALLNGGSHKLACYDCGLPSQTSACQAGIMYGNNADIPGFRWYDKQLRRVIVSNHLNDANLINNAASTGAGLLRDGSSVSNLINGDASRSLLTLSTLSGQSRIPTVHALDDLSSFWFNPYTFTRTLAGCIGDMVREVLESLRQEILDERPRLDRLFNGQIFLRVLTNIFLRDLSAYVVMLDIIRGAPIIYTTFMGYDQVAHHAGPDSSDALRTLKGLDKQLRHMLQTIQRLALQRYDVYVLSDHGQAFGPTFAQRYGKRLRDLIDELTSYDISVQESQITQDKQSYTAALINELNAAGEALSGQPNMRFRRAVMRQAARTLERQAETAPPSPSLAESQIIVCVSGNLAHVYFDLAEGKAPLSQVEAAHPRLVRGLVAHEGVGFVAGYTDNGEVVVLGPRGARNLNTGALTGDDPLAPYGNAELRAAQLLRIAEFRNSGDLILNSTVFPDGTVASFEELIGVHGGLGGQQTDAFIACPAEVRIDGDGIISATQVYDLLMAGRNGNTNLKL